MPLFDRPVAVIGSGVMGKGIVEALLQNGYQVLLVTRDSERAQALFNQHQDLEISTDYAKLAETPMVIEAVVEDSGIKAEILTKASSANLEGIIASNTSSLPMAELSRACARPERFLGLHFFNPAPRMRGVEVISGPETSPGALEQALRFVESLGKEAVLVKDGAGFVTTRLLMAYFLEAMRMAGEGHHPMAVDQAMKACVKMPMGPFALMDLIGLDVVQNILGILRGRLGSLFDPPPILQTLVREGKLGWKRGQGFHAYAEFEGATEGREPFRP